MSEPSSTERRKLHRGIQRIPASFRSEGIEGQGYVKNISKDGLFLRVDPLPSPGAHCEVLIEPTDGPKVEVAGTVQWTTTQLPSGTEAKSGFGMKLDACTADYQAMLEDILLH